MRIGIDVQTLQTHESTRGIGRLAARTIDLLAGAGHELVLCGAGATPGTGVESHLGGNVTYAAALPEALPAAALALQPTRDFLPRLQQEHGIELYHVTSPLMPDIVLPLPGAVPLAATLLDAIPAMMQARGTPLLAAADYESYLRRVQVLREADVYLPISASAADDCAVLLDLPAERMVVTYVPIMPQVVDAEERTQLLAAVSVSLGAVLCVSGFHPRKNIPGMMHAYAALPLDLRRQHPLVLVCGLQPEERQAVLTMARDAGIADTFIATGYVDDKTLAALLASAAVMFFPSAYEGFGIPPAESLALGVPVVAGNHSSLPEVVGPGGILLEAPVEAQPVAAAQALRTLLENEEERRRLGEAGREHAGRFAPDRYLARLATGYDAAVARAQEAKVPRKAAAELRLATAAPSAVRRTLGLPLDAFVMVAAPGLADRGWAALLFSVFGALHRSVPEAHLVVLGPWKSAELQRAVAYLTDHRLRHGARIVGQVEGEEASLWYSAADVLVTPPSATQQLLTFRKPTITLLDPGDDTALPPDSVCWKADHGPQQGAELLAYLQTLHAEPTLRAALARATAAA